jgi:hypothetical protein
MNSRVPGVVLEHWRKDAIIMFLTLNVIGLIGFITFTRNQSQSTWQEPSGERNPFRQLTQNEFGLTLANMKKASQRSTRKS